ncbi:MAG: tRNA dimethylallyltransferase [Nitrospirales bacterium]|nr:MAG: tRNA dimethylallyltransferase [Nitrospirales bacterium]
MRSVSSPSTSSPVIVLTGPTAIGKSRIAIEVATALETEILTADSRQVYRGMDIGTDKPTMTERQGVPHQMLDLVNPDEHFTVGDYRQLATATIDRLHQQGKVPLIAGGTGLYIRALLHGLWSGPAANWELRKQLDSEAQEKGVAYVHQRLSRVDPELAKRLHPNDYVKVQRGLEVYHALGVPLSEAHHRHGFQDTPYHALIIGLNMERECLYQRINARVELEIEKGLIQETRQLLDQGFHRDLSSMKSLGYRQIAAFIAGDCAYEEAVRILKRDTRHFAKRQMTWFRKEPNITWIQREKQEFPRDIADRVLEHVHTFLSTLNHGEAHNPTHSATSFAN